jgi:type I restriction enzyme S subunit
MDDINNLITDNIDVWVSAINKRSSQGRGSNKKVELTGIKKLRELILELAVRGKLVPQDSNDEPAKVLLERISKEKDQLIKDKKIKKPKSLAEITDEEKQFELPDGWEWSKLQDIGHDLGQKTPDNDFTYIDVASINKELGYIDEPSILTADNAPSRARKIVKKGTVIYSTVRPYLLNIAVVNQDFIPAPIASTAFSIIHPLTGILAAYIYRYLRSPIFITYVESVQTGIAYPAINDKQFFSGIIAIPPFTEQERIVSKVDELMVLCDELEQQTEQSLAAHQTLVEVLLSTLTASDNTEDFQTNWQRIAEHFDVLFTTEHSIELLKQTILQLAVMGKLVPQNPNDEPASVLLEKIAAEKAQLIADKKIKKQKQLPLIRNDEKQFKIPNTWHWTKLNDISVLKGGFAFKSTLFVNDSKHQVIRMGNIRPNRFRLNEKTVFINEDLALNTQEYRIVSDDILLTMTGTKGKRDYLYSLIVNDEDLIDRELYLNQRLCISRTILTDSKFVNLLLKDDRLLDFVYAKSTGTANQANIGIEAIQNWVLPLPPLAEQKRIVVRVDELMVLCEQIKARLADSQTTQLHLADAIVQQAIN